MTFCLSAKMNEAELEAANSIVQLRKTIKKGSRLYKVGMGFHAVYAIRSGFFKTTSSKQDGKVYLIDFYMQGDRLGLDGISHGKHLSDAVALEDSEVCVIPFYEIEKLSRVSTSYQRHFLQTLSKDIFRENDNQRLLSQMSAVERVATFIQNLMRKSRTRGFSRSEILLRMTRVEMAQYLGLTQETICRTLTKLVETGVIRINQRHLQVLNDAALERITGISI